MAKKMDTEKAEFNVLGSLREDVQKSDKEILLTELSTLRIYPLFSPKLDEFVNKVLNSFEKDLLEFLKNSANDEQIFITDNQQKNKWKNKVYHYLLETNLREEIKLELYYLIKIVLLQKNYDQVQGNLVSFIKDKGFELNRSNLEGNFIQKKLLLSTVIFILDSKFSTLLSDYINLYKKYNPKVLEKPFKLSKDSSPEEFIISAIIFKINHINQNDKSNFSEFVKYTDVPRTTLIEKINKHKIKNTIDSILE